MHSGWHLHIGRVAAGCAVAAVALASPARAAEQRRDFDIPAQQLARAILAFSRQSDQMVVVAPDLTADRSAAAIAGRLASSRALALILAGSGLRAERYPDGGFVIVDHARHEAAQRGPAARPAVTRLAMLQQPGTASDVAPAIVPPPASDQEGIQDIVVTARRRNESLQSVPLAVSALTQDQLARQNVVSVADLQARVPSLQARQQNASRDQVSFRIRGQGQAQAGALPGVVTYFLDVPTNAAGPGLLFDLESLQVLKGPQGTLFGRNSTGGAILLNPVRPTDQLGGYVEATIGNLDARRVQAAINAPLLDGKIRLRFALDRNRRDGFTRNLTNGVNLDERDYFSWRASAVVAPIEGVEDYFVYNQFRSRTTGGSLVLLDVRPGSPFATLNPGALAELDAQRRRGIRRIAQSLPLNRDEVDSRAATNILTYRISDALTFKNILGYRMFRQRLSQDVDASPFAYIEQLYTADYQSGAFSDPRSQEAYSAETQLQFKLLDGRVAGTVGAYWDQTKPYSGSDLDTSIQLGNRIEVSSLRDDRSKAVFGQVTADLAGVLPGLSVTAGGRYTKDDRELRISNRRNGVCTTVLPDDGCFRTLNTAFKRFTYNLSVEYKLASRTLLYLATRKGYKGGGFNPGVAIQGAGSSYGPEIVTDFEAGLKSDFQIARVPTRLNIAAYTSNYDDIQRSTQLVINGQATAAIANAGKARIRGVEVEYTLRPARGLNIGGFYAYTDARYRTAILRPISFQNTPKNKIGINASYLIETGQGDLTPAVIYNYTSSFHASNNPDARDIQKGFSTFDARIDWARFLKTPINVYGFVNNVTGRKYVTGMVGVYNTLGYITASYSEPRTYGIGARYTF